MSYCLCEAECNSPISMRIFAAFVADMLTICVIALLSMVRPIKIVNMACLPDFLLEWRPGTESSHPAFSDRNPTKDKNKPFWKQHHPTGIGNGRKRRSRPERGLR